MNSLFFLLGCQLCTLAVMQYRGSLRDALWFSVPGWLIATTALLMRGLPFGDFAVQESVVTAAAIACAGPLRLLLRRIDRRPSPPELSRERARE